MMMKRKDDKHSKSFHAGFLMIGMKGCPYSELLSHELKLLSHKRKVLWISPQRTLQKQRVKEICQHPSFPILFRIPSSKWSTVPPSIKQLLNMNRSHFQKIGGYDDFVHLFQ